jgi:hypothetical protein
MRLKHFVAMLLAGIALAWEIDFVQEGFASPRGYGLTWFGALFCAAFGAVVGFIHQYFVRHINVLDLIIPSIAVVAVVTLEFKGSATLEAALATLLAWAIAYWRSFRSL